MNTKIFHDSCIREPLFDFLEESLGKIRILEEKQIEGVEQDYEMAWDLFQQAAEMDQANAIFLIGECYYEGKAVEKDLEKAAEWYRKALDAGYKPDEVDQKHLEEVLGEDYAASLPA